MRKELTINIIFAAAYFLLITLLRNWFGLLYWPFWLGGLLGVFLPLVDYLINVYVVRSDGNLSEAATKLTDRSSVMKNLNQMAKTRVEHKDLIFHTAYFQIIFIIFTYWMMTSSTSLFGMGLALSFLLHLLIDQLNDFTELGTIKHWFTKLAVNLSRRDEKLYLLANVFFLIAFGFFVN